ncbi:MAG: ATP-dependent helicase [Bacteroidales bacterium]|jgi:DNA helicase-2/ATP-dependent DNA helicase PcrA|nr:ATP-dependent helicase [Bacteroidales bacterium]MDI9575597.1 ATP-dependent helicase [Bacteroidota bacterium]MDD2593276.1 ATP-dependent helicase [Bacteroidales bacterium]MDD3755874.1 ATP-dependent helicase [Bacteroidales bacterium]MDY0400942.1 ATP-dependent helicase [Bacteroidales bacterium]
MCIYKIFFKSKNENRKNSNREQNSEISTNDIINDLDINDDKDIETLLMKLSGRVKETNTNLINRGLKEILSDYSFDDLKLDDKSKKKILELKELAKNIENKIIKEPNYDATKNYKIDYANELNNEQLIAVTTTDIPLLVIAGAGSGKTRVITYKVCYLIENGVNPNSILLLTFTKKAAQEMLDRVNKLLKNKIGGNVLGGTFHSFANYILRRYSKVIGIKDNFTIIDTTDSADIFSLLKSELKINKKIDGKPFPDKKELQEITTKARNIETSINNVIDKFFYKYIDYTDEIITLIKYYEKYKKTFNLLDYDDLIIILRDNLRDNAGFLKAVQNEIEYVLVDEYQDTNTIQRDIADLIASKNEKITVVGDDAQSIYTFRGADYENILRFPQFHPNCGVVKLECNYRSNQNILYFINSIISNAQIGYKKNLYTNMQSSQKPIFKKFANERDEAKFIVDKILEIKGDILNYNDFAILTRAAWHSNVIQTELMARGIPFDVIGGIKFAERAHVKDIIAFLRIIINHIDAISWHRILQLIDGIGNVRATEIITSINKKNGIIEFSEFQNRKYYDELNRLENMYNKIINNDNIKIDEIFNLIYDFYIPLFKKNYGNYDEREQDLEVLRIITSNYESIEKFLDDFTLEPPNNKFHNGVFPGSKNNKDTVKVSTIHSAKGLEWNTVFIPHAIDGLFPSEKSLSTLEDLEEERRVFYVACSRAKENLFITIPVYLESYRGYTNKPSRFIYEIDPKFYFIEGND